FAGVGEYRTAPSVEVRIVLENSPSCFGCVETRSAAFQNFVTSSQCPLKPFAIFPLLFRCHAAALNRSGAAVNHESNSFCFHVWIVFGALFRYRCNRLTGFLGKHRRRSIKEQERKEAIGHASSRHFHRFKRKAGACEMSKRINQRLKRWTAKS